jgi:hypothetical protein
MRNALLISVVAAVAALAAGCFEQTYMSAAPDGTIVICAGGKLVRVSSDLSTATLVAESILRAEYSPDGAKLLCVLTVKEGEEERLEIAITDTQAVPQVTLEKLGRPSEKDDAARMFCPRWSPDGNCVSYLVPNADVNGIDDLHIRKSDGTEVLTIPKVSVGYAWSADSKAVAVISMKAGDGGEPALGRVQVWNVEEGKVNIDLATVLFQPFGWAGWDAAGGKVLFSAADVRLPLSAADADEAAMQVFEVNAEGGRVTPLLDKRGLGFGEAGIFEVSPDGKKIAYVTWYEEMTGSICAANIDGTVRQTLAEFVEVQAMPRWVGPNRLAYIVKDKGKDETQLYVQEIGGKAVDILPLLEKAMEGAGKAGAGAAKEEPAATQTPATTEPAGAAKPQ